MTTEAARPRLPKCITVNDVAEALNVSTSHAYALMKTMPHAKIGTSLRVTEADFATWFERNKKAPCDSTLEGQPGGAPGPKTARPSGVQPVARKKRRRVSSLNAGSESAPIRLTQPRRKPPSP